MGNSQTKQARQPATLSSSGLTQQSSTTSSNTSRREREADHQEADRLFLPSHTSNSRRASRPDLSFLGLGHNSSNGLHDNSDRDLSTLEVRRETKQEREARKLEKERVARLKERERSMRGEHVDGGYLVTQGVYVGTEDYNKAIVRQLMIERRLAPFWRGLNEFSSSWAEHQLMAAARGITIPPADEVPPELEFHGNSDSTTDFAMLENSMSSSTVAEESRTPAHSNESLAIMSPSSQTSAQSQPSPTPLFRTRAKTLASLSTPSRSHFQADMSPREFQLPKDPLVNGQPIEVFLYKDAVECPICFLYYPPYLNTTRCCDQAICSECFVQIKRADPHPPEHEQPESNVPAASAADRITATDGQLVSEPATCPFCKQPEFGITYSPPSFRRGLAYCRTSHSATSLHSPPTAAARPSNTTRRRGSSLSTTDPGVITTDKVRPDWASKLASARAHAARRSAAATALHTAAYLMGGSNHGDQRVFAPFGRRNVLRRSTLEGSSGASAQHDALTMLAERHQMRYPQTGEDIEGGTSPFLPPPRGSSSRGNRVDELEDIMMMEAIRLSLAAEDDRRRKEEKEAKKEAKKKEKEAKKAEKASKKNAAHVGSSGASYAGTDSRPSSPPGLVENSSVFANDESGDIPNAPSKGKAIDRNNEASAYGLGSTGSSAGGVSSPSTSTAATSARSYTTTTPPPNVSEPTRPSHLRQMSTASSSASSIIDPVSTNLDMTRAGTPSGGNGGAGVGTEPMFNFRSLAAMIGDTEDDEKERGKEEGGEDDVDTKSYRGAPQPGNDATRIEHSAYVKATPSVSSEPVHPNVPTSAQ